jgi:hypothetical protein
MGVCPNSLGCPAQSDGLGEAGRPEQPGVESVRGRRIRGEQCSLAAGAVR